MLGLNQDAARGHFNPAEGGAAEVSGRLVSFHVFCSHFNCDKELSLGNSLSAWEKALLPFSLKKVVVEFLFGDLRKRVTEAGMRYSLAEEAGR